MGLRVALDAGPLHGHRTGVGVAVAELAAHLAERDDIELIPYLLSYRARPGLTAGRPTRRLPVPAALAHRLWARVPWPRLEGWLGDADVVHGTNYVVPPSRRPRVVSVYDCWFLAHPEQATPDVRRAGAVLRRSVVAGATVLASSHATADAARELLGARDVEVVLLGLPSAPTPSAGATPDGAVTGSLAGRSFVLALGTLERRKNLALLVDAFGRQGHDELLVLAGAPGDGAAAVDAAMDRLSPDRRAGVRRLGPVDDATKTWLLAHAAVLAYPSLDEGFGFPLLEAQAAGLPVVASRAGSIPEVGGEGVELVDLDRGGADELAAALTRVVGDDGRRVELIAAGHRNLSRFSWSATAAAVATVYARVAEP